MINKCICISFLIGTL